MKRWKMRLLGALLATVAMLFAVSGLTATAQVVNYDFDAYVCEDLDGDGLIDTCSTCFDTDGDGLVDTCYEDANAFDRIGEPVGFGSGPVGFNDPVNFGPTGLGGPVDFNDSEDSDGSSVAEGGGEDPIASDAGKGEE